MQVLSRSMKRVTRILQNCHVGAYAASCAFFLFLSLVPLVVLVCSLLPYTPLTQQQLLDWAGQMIPEHVSELLVSIAEDVYDASAAVLPLSLLLTLWSAAKSFSALSAGVAVISGAPRREPYLLGRLRAMLYTVAFLLAIVLSLSLLVFGESLLRLAQRVMPQLVTLLDALRRLRVVTSVLLLTMLFAGIYTFAPKSRSRYSDALPGALAAASTWVIAARLFSRVVTLTGTAGTYGSLSAIVLVMLWMYLSMYILLLGALSGRLLRTD